MQQDLFAVRESSAQMQIAECFNPTEISTADLYQKVTGFDMPAGLTLRQAAESLPMAQMVAELSKRYFTESLPRGDALINPDAVRLYLLAKLRDQPAEVFACLFLDTRHRVIAYDELFFGTIDSALVHPREVVRKAIKHNAAAVIFAHNHPSGLAEPSRADEQITQKLKDALSLLDVRVLDHFVIGDTVVSFAERGLL
jgi:DNA repair protein RadC